MKARGSGAAGVASHPSPLLLSVEDAASQLGIGRGSAYQLVRSRQLPSVRVGRRVLIRRSDLERFVAEKANDDDLP
jgi:excisionase family DNA binding protein